MARGRKSGPKLKFQALDKDNKRAITISVESNLNQFAIADFLESQGLITSLEESLRGAISDAINDHCARATNWAETAKKLMPAE